MLAVGVLLALYRTTSGLLVLRVTAEPRLADADHFAVLGLALCVSAAKHEAAADILAFGLAVGVGAAAFLGAAVGVSPAAHFLHADLVDTAEVLRTLGVGGAGRAARAFQTALSLKTVAW